MRPSRNKMHKSFALIFIASLFVACSSQVATTTNNGPTRQGTNSSTVPVVGPSTAANEEPLNSNHTPTRDEIREKLRQKGLINAPSSGPLPTPQFKPAADNSIVSTTMNAQGAVVETRIFKGNPQIASVVMTWVGPNDNTLKIFLRNGRVVEAKADNIENLGSTPVSVFIEKAGIKPGK